jgi:hypothetical protein
MSVSSPEDGKRFSFRNGVFYSYFEFRAMDKAHRLGDSNKIWTSGCSTAFVSNISHSNGYYA